MSTTTIAALVVIAVISFGLSYLGSAVGLVLGQLRVMLLVYVLGDVVVGTSTSLVISTCGTLAGVLPHLRGKRISPMLLLTIGAPSAIAAHLCARYATHADPQVVKGLIAVVVFLAGLELLRGAKKIEEASRKAPAEASREEARGWFRELPRPVLIGLEIGVGIVLGAMSGVVGLLLGSLRLPAMVRLARVEPAVAVGTNMAIGAITGLAGGLGASVHGHVDLPTFFIVMPLTILGAHMGAKKAGTVDRGTLLRWMGYALIPTALLMMVESRFKPAQGPRRPRSAEVQATARTGN